MTELEVVWDGAHHGRDADLLMVPPVEAKRGTAPRTFRRGELSGTLIEALRRAPSTLATLVGVTGIPRQQLIDELSRLRKERRVAASEGPSGRVYRLTLR